MILGSACATAPAVARVEPAAAEVRVLGAPVRFLSRAEAAAFLEAPDDFTARLSDFDRAFRMGRVGVDDGTYRAFVGAQGLDWPAEEQAAWTAALTQIDRAMADTGMRLPGELVLIRTTGRDELDAAYTRRNAIILPSRRSARTADKALGLAAHELFHVYSRVLEAAQRDRLYAVAGFVPVPEVRLSEPLSALRVTNPDGYSLGHATAVTDGDGATRQVVPLVVSKVPAAEAITGGRIGDVIKLRLLVVGAPGGVLEVEATDYAAQVGKNTGYIIHPDEVLADNFSLLVRQRLGAGQELEHAEVLEALASALTELSQR